MKQSISTLIVMLTISFFIAFLIVIFLVVKYSTPGSLQAKELLLSPKAFNEKVFTYKTRNGRRLDIQLKGMYYAGQTVDALSYKQFYDSVKKVKSLSAVTPKIADPFNMSAPATLTIFVFSGDNETGESRIFQQIEFLDDHFRILVSGDDPTTETWVYFESPGIYRKANGYFAEKQISLSWNWWSGRCADGGLQLSCL